MRVTFSLLLLALLPISAIPVAPGHPSAAKRSVAAGKSPVTLAKTGVGRLALSASIASSRKSGTAAYKRINALRTARVASSVRGSYTPVHTRHISLASIPAPAPISSELRASAFTVISERMGSAPDHFQETAALRRFFDRLAQSSHDGSPIHVLQYGDSHTASDDWVESMRESFQGRYGFGGSGFIMAGHPFKGYRRFDARGQSSAGWQAEGLLGHPGDYRHGLSGVSMTAKRPGETITLTTSGEQLELYYLRQPGGGSFNVESDGQPVQTINSDGASGTSVLTLSPVSGEHIYTVRTLSYLPVRLFGWVSQNHSGVTWETLGINGAQAGIVLGWDEVIWAQQIQRRDPALIVIAYGTNEAVSPSWTAEEYRSTLSRLIKLFQRTVPSASLLLVGPPDCGRLHPFPHLQEVVEVQREVAQQSGIAFWDWRHHMGGPGATHMWVRAGLSQPDYTHLTGDGYRMLGKTLAEELDLEYRRYVSPPIAQVELLQ